MEETALRPSLALRRLVNGYQVSQAIHVAATLGIADLLISGPKSSDELAAESSANPDALYRLLRALAAVGIFHEDDDRRFSLTDLGECLRSDAPEPVAGWAAFIGQPSYWQVWGDLFNSVKTGENAFRHVHGVDVWTYRSEHPEVSAPFDRAMTDLSRLAAVEVVILIGLQGAGKTTFYRRHFADSHVHVSRDFSRALQSNRHETEPGRDNQRGE